MKIAYLTNVYPAPSHSFVRREILALEECGRPVARFSIRRSEAPLRDPGDQAESQKTDVLLEAGPIRILLALLFTALSSPIRFARAKWLSLQLGRRSDRGLIHHAIYLAEACLLLHKLQKSGVTHLHAHFGTNSATVAMLTHVLGGPPYSFTVHGPEEFDKATILGLGAKVHRAKFVVAISEFGRSQLYRWSQSEDWSKIQVVHCGLDDSYLSKTHEPVSDSKRFVCVGRLCEQKGQLLLVDAFAKLIKSGTTAQLVLVGDGPMRPEIEAFIAKQGLGEHVRITGWASGETVQKELADARVMVLPSFAEGLPVVIMEALAMERPVISTYIAGIPELVEPGKNGWLVPAGDVEALVEAMRAALEIPVERLREMGKAGRDRVIERHNIKTEVKKLAGSMEQGAWGREHGAWGMEHGAWSGE